MSMQDTTHIVGYGVLGREIARQMLAAGRPVTIIQRSRPRDMPTGAAFISADIMDKGAVVAATSGATAIVCALGLPYFARLWETGWPLAMSNILAACEAHGARLVFADNLYLYGPQDRPLTEDLPPVDYGRKPKARAEVTRLWQAAHSAGRVQAVAVRPPTSTGRAWCSRWSAWPRCRRWPRARRRDCSAMPMCRTTWRICTISPGR